MPDDATEFNRAFQALLDRYPKGRVLAALQETPLRPGPKRKDDTEILIRMGRVMTWHRDLSDRAAAAIVTRHLPNDRRSVIDRIRKGFAKDREYYLRTGKVNEIIHFTLEAMFQELRSKLRAVCMLTDKDPIVVFPKLGEIRPE